MDYEKKYKEALERFKTFREKYCTYGELHFGDVIFDKTGEAQKDLDAIFPELRESEDERIRKEIIDYLTLRADVTAFIDEEKDCKRWIAYLEKQKEQKKDNPLEDFSRGYNAGYYHGITDSEQKPAQTETEKQYVRTLKALVSDFIRDRNPEDVPYYQGIFDWLDGRHIEQKPAEWSEEDEETLEKLHRLLVICRGEKKFIQEADYNKMDNFLKSLRPSKDCSSCAKHLEGYISGRSDAENKLLEQFGAIITPEDELRIKPRWKPSEQENRLINTSISFLKDFADKGYENAVECIDWLKSKLNGNTCKQNESGSESHYPEHA